MVRRIRADAPAECQRTQLQIRTGSADDEATRDIDAANSQGSAAASRDANAKARPRQVQPRRACGKRLNIGGGNIIRTDRNGRGV